MEIALELIRELAKDDSMMWVVGGADVVSENNSKGITEPEFHNGYVTVQADNWHFHVGINKVAGIQFVEAESHPDLTSYYVRFSDSDEGTLLRAYFPNPYLDDNYQRVEFQPEKFKIFQEMRDQYVDRDGIVFVRRPSQTNR